MQIDKTVHGCPVAVVHLIVRLEILALQVKSGPPRGNRLWLRPQAALWQTHSLAPGGQDHGFQTGRGLVGYAADALDHAGRISTSMRSVKAVQSVAAGRSV